MILAFDDTDSSEGGCTTHAMFEVLAALLDLAPRGMPRLVRLNPNVPWKTRGNGAVCVELVRPTGPHVVVGEWNGMELRAYPEGDPVPATEKILDTIWSVIEHMSEPDAQPAAVLFDGPPSPLAYWQAVRTIVDPEEVLAMLTAMDEKFRFSGDGRALIGCLAAASWSGPASSYEFLAYRGRPFWGTERRVNEDALFGLDATGRTFHTEDPEQKTLCCVPNTPCPVLLGLRGRDAEGLLQTARSTVPLAAEEPLGGWILWATNQASGDHVTDVPSLAEAMDGMTVRIPATVEGIALNLPGGHVRVPMIDTQGNRFDAMAFEPTKSFRDVVRRLMAGDRVQVTGGISHRTLRLESLDITSAVKSKSENPVHCNRSMKSRGADAGYKCVECGALVPETAATYEDRSELENSYEVPVIARRHLHRPLAWEPPLTPHAERFASAPTFVAEQ